MKPIRTVKNSNSKIFLTFDDGPHDFTSSVLDRLGENGVKATFFVVAQRAQQRKELLLRIISEGHTLGNHSLDHSYYHFFRGEEHLRHWVEASQKKLEDLSGQRLVGFRSPAGVQTPPLARALKALDIPWIHWEHRFYDTVWKWTKRRVERKLSSMKSGDIVLLHDNQRPHFQESFLEALSFSIQALRDKKFDFQELRAEY